MERSEDKPQKSEQQEQPAKKRFAIHKLEERIAPKGCQYNYAAQKWVGCGNRCHSYGCW
jgi:hypothetical protein